MWSAWQELSSNIQQPSRCIQDLQSRFAVQLWIRRQQVALRRHRVSLHLSHGVPRWATRATQRGNAVLSFLPSKRTIESAHSWNPCRGRSRRCLTKSGWLLNHLRLCQVKVKMNTTTNLPPNFLWCLRTNAAANVQTSKSRGKHRWRSVKSSTGRPKSNRGTHQ